MKNYASKQRKFMIRKRKLFEHKGNLPRAD